MTSPRQVALNDTSQTLEYILESSGISIFENQNLPHHSSCRYDETNKSFLMPEEITLAPEPTPPTSEKVQPNKASFWSFNVLYIVKQLSTVLHALAQVAGTG